jgi:3-hydroxyisobutyrate dehydrogenase-like beta-hydroxyacid dehydrogenase
MVDTSRVGFIGLGYMGHGMATNILAKGFPLTVLAHRKRAAVEDLAGKGAFEANSARELAERSDIVLLCVSGPEHVDDLVRRADGLAAGAAPGTIIVDCTTSAPSTLLSLAEDFPELTFVDSPLGRSPKEAWAGELSVMVGSTEDTLEAIRPVLSAFATTIQHAGPPGSGHALKLVNNVVSLGYAALYSEAMVLAQKAGLGIKTFDELIGSSRMNCEFFQTFMGWARNGDSTTHRFALSLAEHTVGDALEFATKSGLDMRVVQAVHEIFSTAAAQGLGEANLPELPRSVAEANAVDLEPQQS